MPSLTLLLIWLKNWFIAGNAGHGHRADGKIVSCRLNGVVATIAVLAESMGSGRASSHAATQVVNKAAKEVVAESKKIATIEILKNAIAQVNRWSYKQHAALIADNDDLAIMIAAIYAQTLDIAYVGNSRAYLFRNTGLARLTVDHTGVQALIANGSVSRTEERTHPTRTKLLRSLGRQANVEVDTQLLNPYAGLSQFRRLIAVELQVNDLILLVSSAVTDQLDDQQIQEVMTHHSPVKAAKQLVRKTQAGGAANAHALVIPYQPTAAQWGRRFYESFIFLLKLLVLPLLLIVVLDVIYLVKNGWPPDDANGWPLQAEESKFFQATCYTQARLECSILAEFIQDAPTATTTPKIPTSEPEVTPLATATATASPVASPQANEDESSDQKVRITDTPVIQPIDRPTEVLPPTPLPVSTLVAPATSAITSTVAFTTEVVTSTPIVTNTLTVTNTTPVTNAALVTSTAIVTGTTPTTLPLVVDLISPYRDVVEVRGNVDFEWQAALLPPAGLGYQIIFWLPGKTPQTGFGIHELIFAKTFARTIPLDELDDQLDEQLLIPDNTYNWAVCLFDPAANRITEQCSADSRKIIFRR